MKQRPTKAVIPVAGYGTRRLPIVKSIEKCMIPILNRPVVDYAVEECAKAGITDILFIVSGQAEQLKKYYSPNLELEDYLGAKGKTAELKELRKVGFGLNFHYKEQLLDRYGTAIPVYDAKEFIGNDESFIVMMGDCFIYDEPGESTLGDCITAWQQSEAPNALISVTVHEDQVSQFGVLKIAQNGMLDGVIEKPALEDAPSNQINAAKYLFNASIFDYLDSYCTQPRSGEYMVTDVIDIACDNNDHFLVFPARGIYLDGGNTAGWLAANQFLASK